MRTKPFHELQRRWRRQLGGRSRLFSHQRRDAGAVGFLVDGDRKPALVELTKLLLLVVNDRPTKSGSMAVELRGYRASRCEHGVLWGGAENFRFRKLLSLSPRPGATGLRIDSRRRSLLELALRLDHRIDQAMKFQPSGHNRRLRLPQVWAGYFSADAGNLAGEGPEFDEACRWYGMSGKEAFEKFRRQQDGLALYPLEWVSSQLDDSVALLAELGGLPRRQAFQLTDYPADLAGCQGAMAYELSAVGGTRRGRQHGAARYATA